MLLRHLLCCELIAISIGYQWGSFDIVEDFIFQPDSDFLDSKPYSPCKCRKLCIEVDECFSFSVHPFRGGWQCLVFNATQIVIPQASAGGLVGYPHVDGAVLKGDFLFYFLPPPLVIATSFEDAKNICMATPCFRLARIKTVASKNGAFDFCWCRCGYCNGNNGPYRYSPLIVVDLRKNPNGTAVYSDGTLFRETELGRILPLCQGNLIHVKE